MKMKNRRKATNRENQLGSILGVAWYSPTQWQQIREVSADAEQLETTFQEWLVAAEQAFEKMTALGIAPIKVPIEAQDLIGVISRMCQLTPKREQSTSLKSCAKVRRLRIPLMGKSERRQDERRAEPLFSH